YRVFNKTSGCVEIACDVTFDESNGSQGEQIDNVVEMEESSSQAIKKLAISEIKPQEQVDNDNDDELMFQGPSTSPSAAKPGNSGYEAGDSGHNDQSIRTPDRSIRFTQAETTTQQQDKSQDDREAEPIQHQCSIPHPRVHHIIQKDHPVDNILGSISKGVTTQPRLATFCEHYSFVSSL